MEVLYFPYYAYEEVLATIADPPGLSNSLLKSMEKLTARISGNTTISMPRSDSSVRERLLGRYRETPASTTLSTKQIFLSYSKADQSIVDRLAQVLTRELGEQAVFWDQRIPLGANWRDALKSGLGSSS